ncbi:MAG: PEP-CTERM sorting domain-containing protein [Verrucomicrobia bacterium]|nr:PEP-CTERM sorting domain-containing protein [Verrucomicrobiota bacterium]
MRLTLLPILSGIALLAFGLSAPAATLFDQTVFSVPPDGTLAGTSDVGQDFIRAGRFQISIAGPNPAQGVRWFGVYYNGAAPTNDDFTIAFHTEDTTNGLPDLAPFASYAVGNVSRVSIGLTEADGGLTNGFEYFATIPDTLLDSGTNYWLSIYNSLSGAEYWAWRSATPSLGGAGLDLTPSGQPWVVHDEYAPAFAIESVPEPSTFALLGIVGLWAGGRRWRRKS